MEIILNLFKVILPAITTGLFTFFITKYTYNRNRPIDKIEIAYDRIYYGRRFSSKKGIPGKIWLMRVTGSS